MRALNHQYKFEIYVALTLLLSTGAARFSTLEQNPSLPSTDPPPSMETSQDGKQVASEVSSSAGKESVALMAETSTDVADVVRRKKILIMSDVDDTLYCPACGQGTGVRGSIHNAIASIAGSDTCPEMETAEIYRGAGLFLWLLAANGFDLAEFVIVSANPWGSIPKYDHIAKYVKTVSSQCQARVKRTNPRASAPAVELSSVRYGQSYSSIRGHVKMGIRKLNSMVLAYKQAVDPLDSAHPFDVSRVVWLGDTGQGDVCAGFCFLFPEHCAQMVPGFFRELNKYHWSIWYPYGAEYVKNPESHPRKAITSDKWAFFHQTTPLRSGTRILQECFDAIETLQRTEPEKARRIVVFGLDDPLWRAADYRDAMHKASQYALLDWKQASDLFEGDGVYDGMEVGNMTNDEINQVYKRGEKTSALAELQQLPRNLLSKAMQALLSSDASDVQILEDGLSQTEAQDSLIWLASDPLPDVNAST